MESDTAKHGVTDCARFGSSGVYVLKENVFSAWDTIKAGEKVEIQPAKLKPNYATVFGYSDIRSYGGRKPRSIRYVSNLKLIDA